MLNLGYKSVMKCHFSHCSWLTNTIKAPPPPLSSSSSVYLAARIPLHLRVCKHCTTDFCVLSTPYWQYVETMAMAELLELPCCDDNWHYQMDRKWCACHDQMGIAMNCSTTGIARIWGETSQQGRGGGIHSLIEDRLSIIKIFMMNDGGTRVLCVLRSRGS